MQRGMCVHMGETTCVHRGPWSFGVGHTGDTMDGGLALAAEATLRAPQHNGHSAVNLETMVHVESTTGMFLRSWTFMKNASVSLTQTFRERWAQCIRRGG